MDFISLQCGSCGAKLKAKGGLKATEVKCPKCGRPILMPKEPASGSAQPTTPSVIAVHGQPEPVPAATVAPPLPGPTAPPPEAKKPIVITPLGKTSVGMVAVICEGCKREMKVPADLAGKKIRCKGCGATLSVPSGGAKESPAVAAAPIASAPSSPPAIPPEARPVAPPRPPLMPITSPGASPETADARLAAAEKRADDAEKALHDLAGQKALEDMAANRRTAELEAKLASLQNAKADVLRDLKAEIEAAEKRVAELKRRLATLTA